MESAKASDKKQKGRKKGKRDPGGNLKNRGKRGRGGNIGTSLNVGKTASYMEENDPKCPRTESDSWKCSRGASQSEKNLTRTAHKG